MSWLGERKAWFARQEWEDAIIRRPPARDLALKQPFPAEKFLHSVPAGTFLAFGRAMRSVKSMTPISRMREFARDDWLTSKLAVR